MDQGIEASGNRIFWSGLVLGVQPRIDLMRSFDQRSRSYLGYLLLVDGQVDGEPRQFTVRVGPAIHARHWFRGGDRLAGMAHPVVDREREIADLYRASGLVLEARGPESVAAGPPWLGVPPPLPAYRARGHRRLDARTYEAKCSTCKWGCAMPVTMIIDQWQPNRRKYRFETFCYGPKSCPIYRAGATRKVPGRRGMTWEEADWVDAEAVEHRGPDE